MPKSNNMHLNLYLQVTATDWLAANNNKSMKGGKLASNSKTLWLTTK